MSSAEGRYTKRASTAATVKGRKCKIEYGRPGLSSDVGREAGRSALESMLEELSAIGKPQKLLPETIVRGAHI